MIVGDTCQAIFSPMIRARARLAVAKVVPRVARLAVVLEYCPPLPLRQVGFPISSRMRPYCEHPQAVSVPRPRELLLRLTSFGVRIRYCRSTSSNFQHQRESPINLFSDHYLLRRQSSDSRRQSSDSTLVSTRPVFRTVGLTHGRLWFPSACSARYTLPTKRLRMASYKRLLTDLELI